jgi:hypothetical protein
MTVTSGMAALRKACPVHDSEFAGSFEPCREDIFAAELVEHERAGHARDIGEAVIAEQQSRQDHVADGVPEDFPLARYRAVDEDGAGDAVDDANIEDVELAGPATQPSL